MKLSVPQFFVASALLPLVFSFSGPLTVRADDIQIGSNSVSITSTNIEDVPVYFGIGCFWHVQHEFVQAEKRILGRTDDQITSTAGYAGGSRVAKLKGGGGGGDKSPGEQPDVVCYHNLRGIADYGSLGHGEVVGVRVPPSAYGAFAQQYFSLFAADLDRPDKGDMGPEYRSLVGLPGGTDSPLYLALLSAAEARGLSLQAGRGDDGDTLGKRSVWVMDSQRFPLHAAELYHQFHDGFMPGEGYPQTYNDLARKQFEAGRIGLTGCPDSVPR